MKIKTPIFITAIIVISAAMLLAIGLWISISPAGFYTNNDIVIGSNVNLISELRAPATMLIAVGSLLLASLFVTSLMRPALLFSGILYLSYSAGRVWGMLAEGMPHESIVAATMIEFVLGIACIGALRQLPQMPRSEKMSTLNQPHFEH